MAKKIPKNSQTKVEPRRPGPSTMSLFILLLIPWIMMGVVAYSLAGTNLPDSAIVVISLGVALVSTFIVGRYVRRKRPMRR